MQQDIEITAAEQEPSNSTGLAEQTHEISKEIKEELIKRREERSLVFFLLYGMDSWGYEISLENLAHNLIQEFHTQIDLNGNIINMAASVIEQRDKLDETIKPLLAHWRIERLGVCTRLILRLAVWEFLYTQTAPQIIMNEAIELAKCFAEKDAYRFINGVLDELSKRLGNKETK